MLEELKKLNARLAQIETDYLTSNLSDFNVYTDFMRRAAPLLTQGKVLSDIGNGLDITKDIMLQMGISQAPGTIIPTQADIFKHHEAVNAFITRTLALQARLDKDCKQHIQDNDPSILFGMFAKAMIFSEMRAPSASSSRQTRQPPASAPAPSAAPAQVAEDDGVSFIKRRGFLLPKQ